MLIEVHGLGGVERIDAHDTRQSLRVHDHEHGCAIVFGACWTALLTPDQARWIAEALYASARRHEGKDDATQS